MQSVKKIFTYLKLVETLSQICIENIIYPKGHKTVHIIYSKKERNIKDNVDNVGIKTPILEEKLLQFKQAASKINHLHLIELNNFIVHLVIESNTFIANSVINQKNRRYFGVLLPNQKSR